MKNYHKRLLDIMKDNERVVLLKSRVHGMSHFLALHHYGTTAFAERYLKTSIGCICKIENSEALVGVVVIKAHRKMISKIRKHEDFWLSMGVKAVYRPVPHEVIKSWGIR